MCTDNTRLLQLLATTGAFKDLLEGMQVLWREMAFISLLLYVDKWAFKVPESDMLLPMQKLHL